MVAFSLFPQPTYAFGFGDLLSVFTKKQTVEPENKKDLHSQNIPLLKPSRSVDPDAVGGGDIQVASGVALVADTGPLGTMVDITEGDKKGSITTYVVQKSDSITSIAEQFDVSVNTIKWANELKGSSVKVGQELVILPVTGVKYTVKNGGSIKDIVKKYGGDAEETARYNGVAIDDDLEPGTVVLIPDGVDLAYEETPVTPKKPSKPKVRSGQTARLHGAGGPAYPGYFAHPLKGAGTRTQGLHGFNGIDIGATRGTPVYAAAAGTVVVSKQPGWNGGYGAYVVIQHDNDSQTLYAHLSVNTASLGQRVDKGDEIGAVGNTGKSTGSHLHFEVRGAKNPF